MKKLIEFIKEPPWIKGLKACQRIDELYTDAKKTTKEADNILLRSKKSLIEADKYLCEQKVVAHNMKIINKEVFAMSNHIADIYEILNNEDPTDIVTINAIQNKLIHISLDIQKKLEEMDKVYDK